jgi:hypothetical protein
MSAGRLNILNFVLIVASLIGVRFSFDLFLQSRATRIGSKQQIGSII